MPRRKGHGISPAKRAAHKDELQARKKTADNNDPGGGRNVQVPQVVPPAPNTTKAKPSDVNAGPDLNSKYLHKKFKKMATASPVSLGNMKNVEEAAVNGLSVCPKEESCVQSATDISGMRTFRGSESPMGSVTLGEAGLDPEASPGTPSVTTATSGSQQGRYVCPYCKLACAKPSVLQKHIRAHTNERPYPCHPCGFAFKTKSNLYKHCRSRAHALKMEEEGASGMKFSFPSADSSEEIDDDEEENNSNNTPPPSSFVSSGHLACATLPVSSTSSSVSSSCNRETNNNQDKPRQIYKPKFHKAALYQEEEEEKEQAVAASMKTKPAAQQSSLSLKIPSTSSHQSFPLSPSVFGSIKNPSSPSPEFITRHISKIISDNQAIMETSEAQWPKKYQQRQSNREQLREGSPASPLSAASSPGLDGTTLWPKKFFHRQMSLGTSVPFENVDCRTSTAQHIVPSKLALALMRPSRLETPSSPRTSDSPMSAVSVSTTPEPISPYQQPLNLSTSHVGSKSSCDNSSDSSSVVHRKRSYSESFGAAAVTGKSQELNSMAILKDHNILPASSKHRGQVNSSKFTRLDGSGNTIVLLDSCGTKNHSNDKLLYHPQNPEGSIIKDLLLKARAASAGLSVTKMGGFCSTTNDIMGISDLSNLPINITEEDAVLANTSSSTQYICPLCNIPYRNAENLEIHQLYYCKGDAASKMSISSALSPQHSPGLPLNYTSLTNQSLELSGQDEEEDNGNSGIGLSLKGMQPLNISKGLLRAGKLDLKSSLLSSQIKENSIKGTHLVMPPFPSPGPLLGSTPLVDSYHQPHHHQKKKKDDMDGSEREDQQHQRGPLPKKRRLNMDVPSRDTSSSTSPDIRPLSVTPIPCLAVPSTTTLRSLEELSKCPMRPNSLQMFGGEVQILDGAGEMKTMRIEPSSRGSKSPGGSGGANDLILSLPNPLNSGNSIGTSTCKSSNSEANTESACGNVSPHIVVTIARSGLHSGGTIVQVPQKSPGASGVSNGSNVKPPRSSGGSINCMNVSSSNNSSLQLQKSLQKNSGSSGGIMLNSPSHSPLPYSTSTLLSSNTNTATNVFSDTTKLLVPIVPNITTPNLAVPGIPAPNLGHYLPFMSCTSILHDGSLLNPLTHITAYNPLTLPPQTNVLHSSSHSIQNMKLSQTPQTQAKEKKIVGMGATPSRESTIPPPYSGGVVTILHGGKAIPYVPGMPGPHTLLSTVPSPIGIKKHISPKPLDLASPSKDNFSFRTTDTIKPSNISSRPSTPLVTKHVKTQAFPTPTANASTGTSGALCVSSHQDEQSKMATSSTSSLTNISAPKALKSVQSALPRIQVDSVECNSESGAESLPSGDESSIRSLSKPPSVRWNSKASKSDLLIPVSGKESEESSLEEGPVKDSKVTDDSKTTKCEIDCAIEEDTKVKSGGNRPKFLRPTSLPLKPGTFTPKKFHGTGLTPTGVVLSLVSPETPRPKKSYGQLYLNGHAYTYLGLKCSTRAYYCTLNRPQPMYVPHSPEHAKLSMYSNWKVCSEADPNPFGLDPGRAMALYDSRHRPTSYTISRLAERQPMVLTHSSYWFTKNQLQKEGVKTEKKEEDVPVEKTAPDPGIKTEGAENSTTGDPPPRRVKIFDGGFESNEEYIYVRGRGRGRYVCEECGIRCKKPSMLKKHIRTHTDVRPFTCKHCNFSFKTKGNLTKHMKSKAHYKKCVELGIVPVPTVVDDSYIDEECLARQQALRASRHGEGDTDSDENEEEEDEDEDDEEDDEEETSLHIAEDGDDMNINKEKLEREAVSSLLSLSESTRVNSHHHYISAGLIPLSASSGRPSTYPYRLTPPLPGPNSLGSSLSAPQTPTLSAVSAQTEREKVSHNTGLALELRTSEEAGNKEEDGHLSSTIRRRGNAASLVLIPPHGDANRYYFPSCRTPTVATNVLVNNINKSISDDKSWTDGGSDSEDYDERDNSSELHTDEDSEISDVERSGRKIPGNTYDKSDNIDGNMLSSQQPMDLSNKSVTSAATCKLSSSSLPYFPSSLSINNARTPTTPISEILTPVSEPATLIASLCSSMERFPVTNSMIAHKSLTADPAETTMLQAYLTERALQDVRMKQHQYQHHHNHHVYTNAVVATSSSVLESPSKALLLRVPTPHADLIVKEPPPRLIGPMISQAPEHASLASQSGNGRLKESDVTIPDPSVDSVESKQCMKEFPDSSEQNLVAPEKSKIKEVISVRVPSTGEGLQTKVPIVSISNSARNVVVGGIAFSTPTSSATPPVSSGINKAEFLPPSSGPSASYVSVTEDGRSICVICNKIFSKPSQLRLHVNIHYFERPFRCESCAVSFRTKGHLQKHERSVSHQNKVSMNSTFGTPTTTNPRPFKCDDCKVAFRIHGHLAKHLRSKMHIMKLECVGKLPFGTYAEMEREGISLNEIDTTDCENSLESLQVLAQKIYDKDPSKLGQWDGERGELLPPLPHPHLSGGETSSDEGEPLPGCQSPHHQDPLSFHVAELKLRLKTHTQEGLGVHVTDVKEESPNLGSVKSVAMEYSQNFNERSVFEHAPGKVAMSVSPINSNSDEVSKGAGKSKSRFNISYLSDDRNIVNRERWQQASATEVTQAVSARDVERREATPEERLDSTSGSVQLPDHQNSGPVHYPNQVDNGSENLQSRKQSCSGEAEYEDTSEGDNEMGWKRRVACTVCQQTFLDQSSLQVHSFVEHDVSSDPSEEQSPLCNRGRPSDSSHVLNQFCKRPAVLGSDIQDPLSKQCFKRSKVESDIKMSPMNCAEVSADNHSSPGSSPLMFHRMQQAIDSRESHVFLGANFTGTSEKRQTIGSALYQVSSDKVNKTKLQSSSETFASAHALESERENRRHSLWTVEGSSDHLRQSINKKTGLHSPKQMSLDHREHFTSNTNNQCQTSKQCLAISYNKTEKIVQNLDEGGQTCDESAKNKVSESELDHEAVLESRVSLSSEGASSDTPGKSACHLCGKEQSSQEALREHLLSHAQLRPFVCEFCDAGFISQQQLQSHSALHQPQ